MPDMNALYKIGTRCSFQKRDDITAEHHYQFDLFNDTIDYQLEELNTRFSEGTIELLTLSSGLGSSNDFKAFKIDDICKLAENFIHEISLLKTYVY